MIQPLLWPISATSIYAYDVNGNFEKWGSPFPTSARWLVVNHVASTIEQPWDSRGLPDLIQITRIGAFQYSSEKAVAAHTAVIQIDDVTVRDSDEGIPPYTFPQDLAQVEGRTR